MDVFYLAIGFFCYYFSGFFGDGARLGRGAAANDCDILWNSLVSAFDWAASFSKFTNSSSSIWPFLFTSKAFPSFKKFMPSLCLGSDSLTCSFSSSTVRNPREFLSAILKSC